MSIDGPAELISSPGCGQCIATEIQFKKHGIPYKKYDVSEDEAALERARALGYGKAPVVIVGDESWFGLRIDKIEELAEMYATA